MKRYLVIFITGGEFAIEVVFASDIPQALSVFVNRGIVYDEIYSVTTAA